MLEPSQLSSALAPPSVEGKPRPADKADGEAFGAVLDEASKAKGGKKTERDGKAEHRDERTAAERRDEGRAQAQRAQDLSPAMRMHKLMQKNVDTLSLAEKQAIHVAEYADKKLAPQASASHAQASAAPAAATQAGKVARSTAEMAPGKAASGRGQGQAERSEEHSARMEVGRHEPARTASQNLDQQINKDASFAEQLSRTGQAERNRDRQGMIDQILAKIEVRNLANRTELNLKLNPEYLGELKIKLVHTDDGVRAEFETPSRTTRQLLRDGEDDLRSQALGKGVRLHSMRFTLVEHADGAGSA